MGGQFSEAWEANPGRLTWGGQFSEANIGRLTLGGQGDQGGRKVTRAPDECPHNKSRKKFVETSIISRNPYYNEDV